MMTRAAFTLLLPIALAAALVTPASANTATLAPVTTARQQLRWLLEASHRVPVPADEQRQHLTPALLQGVGGADGFNRTLTQLGPLTLLDQLRNQPNHTQAVVGAGGNRYVVDLRTAQSGLIGSLVFTPYLPAPRSWPALDTQLRALAPRVSFTSAVIDPRAGCRQVHGVNARRARPLGSAFKLYVLGALGRAVATHRTSWDHDLAIREQWKSLPSGQLQDVPAGTELTLRQYADLMISISDNTAADHLIHYLGREAVQHQVVRFGSHHRTANVPFLTTREMFALKSVSYPALASAYLSLPRPARATMLPGLDRIPRSMVHGWTAPEKIDRLEWFGSPADICRAFSGLWRQAAKPGTRPIGEALSINDGGVGLDRAQFPTVWFKGGSEPGVLTLNFLARTRHGRIVMTSVMLSDPSKPLNEAAVIPSALAIARAGLQRAART